MLYGELLKLAAFHELVAFHLLAAEFQKGISLKSLLFINTMECKGIINFGHIHKFGIRYGYILNASLSMK